MSESPRVLSVGQCAFDGPRIKRLLESKFDVSVVTADSVSDAQAELEGHEYDLVVTNRILDATGEEGMAVVKAAREHGTKVMLVSNYDDAQTKAVDAGAEPGFGKADLESEQTASKINAALGRG